MKQLKAVFRNGDSQTKQLWISVLLGLFVASGVFGFIYETIFYWFNSGMLLKRGAMFLPIVPIYSFGGLLIFLTAYDLRRSPLRVVLTSAVVSGLVEFITGYLMYHLGGGYRAWDYNVEKWNWGNIGGYVCFRSVAFFAISGLLLIYVIVPLLLCLAKRIGIRRFLHITAAISAIVLIDFAYNYVITNLCPLDNARVLYAKLGLPSE